MCLLTKNKEGIVSDEPKRCYKLYRRCSDGRMTSFYTYKSYEMKEGNEIVAEGGGLMVNNQYNKESWYLEEGYIHAMEEECFLLTMPFMVSHNTASMIEKVIKCPGRDLEKIDKMLDDIKKDLEEFYICEMEIPAGERYWVGTSGDVCARRMVFKKEIKLENKFEVSDLVYSYYLATTEKEEIWRTEVGWKFVFDRYKEKGE